ncbi:MAG: hypothetical protein K6B75_07820 [Lachnospiraceae bacterium]|nr:hypothetical protein [Lachnospiraceae bacterium]
MKKIMIIATFHMDTDADMVNTENTDLLDEMDEEFERLNDRLAAFKPNKVFVEFEREYNDELEKGFEKFKINGGKSRNEIVKIAFPVAKRCDAKVYGVDWMEQGAATRPYSEIDEGLDREPALAELLKTFTPQEIDLGKGLMENLRLVNSELEVKKSKAFYVNIARLGAQEYFGMGWLIWWYQRNLNIFANIAANMEDGDRGIVLMGAAHKGILEELFSDSRDFEIEKTDEYLL